MKEIKNITEAPQKQKQIFRCRNCEFETNSEKGLKSHNTKKHTKAEDKGVRFECSQCKYVFNSRETLEVHIGKNHTDQFKCGLCENEFGTMVNLETHLNTCEVYQCSKCSEKRTLLHNIKEHVETKHKSESYLMINNYKLSRENSEEVTWRNL